MPSLLHSANPVLDFDDLDFGDFGDFGDLSNFDDFDFGDFDFGDSSDIAEKDLHDDGEPADSPPARKRRSATVGDNNNAQGRPMHVEEHDSPPARKRRGNIQGEVPAAESGDSKPRLPAKSCEVIDLYFQAKNLMNAMEIPVDPSRRHDWAAHIAELLSYEHLGNGEYARAGYKKYQVLVAIFNLVRANGKSLDPKPFFARAKKVCGSPLKFDRFLENLALSTDLKSFYRGFFLGCVGDDVPDGAGTPDGFKFTTLSGEVRYSTKGSLLEFERHCLEVKQVLHGFKNLSY